MSVVRLDHLVLTVADIDSTVRFYVDLLGMEDVVFGEGRRALAFGRQKINLHQRGREHEPKAARPTPGSADLCFVVDEPLEELTVRFREAGVPVVEGPVRRTGATGPIDSVYVRDPDENLVELSVYRVEPSDGGAGSEVR